MKIYETWIVVKDFKLLCICMKMFIKTNNMFPLVISYLLSIQFQIRVYYTYTLI